MKITSLLPKSFQPVISRSGLAFGRNWKWSFRKLFLGLSQSWSSWASRSFALRLPSFGSNPCWPALDTSSPDTQLRRHPLGKAWARCKSSFWLLWHRHMLVRRGSRIALRLRHLGMFLCSVPQEFSLGAVNKIRTEVLLMWQTLLTAGRGQYLPPTEQEREKLSRAAESRQRSTYFTEKNWELFKVDRQEKCHLLTPSDWYKL